MQRVQSNGFKTISSQRCHEGPGGDQVAQPKDHKVYTNFQRSCKNYTNGTCKYFWLFHFVKQCHVILSDHGTHLGSISFKQTVNNNKILFRAIKINIIGKTYVHIQRDKWTRTHTHTHMDARTHTHTMQTRTNPCSQSQFQLTCSAFSIFSPSSCILGKPFAAMATLQYSLRASTVAFFSRCSNRIYLASSSFALSMAVLTFGEITPLRLSFNRLCLALTTSRNGSSYVVRKCDAENGESAGKKKKR